jgi:hypothetical protein
MPTADQTHTEATDEGGTDTTETVVTEADPSEADIAIKVAKSKAIATRAEPVSQIEPAGSIQTHEPESIEHAHRRSRRNKRRGGVAALPSKRTKTGHD